MLKKNEAIQRINELGTGKVPFVFYCDFLGENWCIEEVSAQNKGTFRYSFPDSSSPKTKPGGFRSPSFEKQPVSYDVFLDAFEYVVGQINIGNSFLTNLTFETPIQASISLKEIFENAKAKYRLLVPGRFVVFSPETFVRIENNQIFSYPMKGTIDANIPNAQDIILNDPKEMAEHVTIVDLIRNDLSQVAHNVTVSRFRYIDEIQTQTKNLLQVSSEITGELPKDWKEELGTILSRLLPAGSISGAPKPSTIKIISEAENYDRGNYSGICGCFDGNTLDSGVMIRFIKEEEGRLIYCSGGGITSFSDPKKEYQEMVDKVYLPF